MLCPFCLTNLDIFTSSESIGNSLFSLSKKILTSAYFIGEPVFPPLKIKLADFSALIDFADNSPRTNNILSITLLFPDPLLPITQLKELPNSNSVGLANDLKPFNLSFLTIVIYKKFSKFYL